MLTRWGCSGILHSALYGVLYVHLCLLFGVWVSTVVGETGTVFVLLVAEVLVPSLADNSTKCSSVKLAILVPGR